MMIQDAKTPFTAVAPCEKASCGDLKCPATFIPTEVPTGTFRSCWHRYIQ